MSLLHSRQRRRRGRVSRVRGTNRNSTIRNPEIIDVESIPDSPTCIDLTEAPDEDLVDLTHFNQNTPVIILSSQSEASTGPRRGRQRRNRRSARTPTLEFSISDDSDAEDLLPVPFSVTTSDANRLGGGDNHEVETGTSGSVTSPETKTISCPVCLDDAKQIRRSGRQIVSTNCGHIFCNQCVKLAIQTQKKCPNCRKKLTLKQYHPIFL